MAEGRILVTGIGMVSAIGNSAEEALASLLSGKSGIGATRHLQTARREFPAGEVKMSDEEMAAKLGADAGEPLTRTSLLGALALREAIASGGVSPADMAAAGFVSGTTVGGMDKSELYYPDFLAGDSHKEYIATHDCGACTEMIADRAGRFAFVTTTSTACSSAANAIILAANLIRCGRLEMAVAGGSECLTKYHLNGFNSLMILDKKPCRPFCATRAGLNLGEGAAYLVLESEANVSRRGASALCQLSGWGNACDAFHQTASSADGEGAYLAMSEALRRARLKAADIDYVNAHGTGTPNNDASESEAMKRLFGDSLPPVSSTKSATGHTTSASGAIEAAICALALRHGFIPANLNWREPMENGVTPVTECRRGVALRHVLCNSFGFGGNDSSLILSATE